MTHKSLRSKGKSNPDARGRKEAKKDRLWKGGELVNEAWVSTMKTLLALFSEGRNELQSKLDKASSAEQVVQLVQNQLDAIERIYISDLSVAQVRLVSYFLETLRQSITTIIAINQTRVLEPPQEEIYDQRRHFSGKKLTWKLLRGLTYIGILGTLFSAARVAPGVWVTILLTSLLVGLEVALELNKDDENRPDYPQFGGALPRKLEVDSKVVERQLNRPSNDN